MQSGIPLHFSFSPCKMSRARLAQAADHASSTLTSCDTLLHSIRRARGAADSDLDSISTVTDAEPLVHR